MNLQLGALPRQFILTKPFVWAAARHSSSLGWHPTGSRALDALAAGGYPSGSIVELHATEPETCWRVAWLAAAAARQRGENVLACGSTAFLDFGRTLGIRTEQDVPVVKLLQPNVLLPAIKVFKPSCALVLIDALAGVAEAAAPAGPDATATRALRNRRLGRFLQQTAVVLQAPPRPSHGRREHVKGGVSSGDGDGGDVGAAGGEEQPQPPAVLLCNPRSGPQGPYDWQLQQYAAMRLKLVVAAVDTERMRGASELTHIMVHLLKGPTINSRMRVPTTQLYLPGSVSSLLQEDSLLHYPPATIDLVIAAKHFGLIRDAAAGQDDKQDSEKLHYRGCETEGGCLANFASKLVDAGLVTELQREVDARIQQLQATPYSIAEEEQGL